MGYLTTITIHNDALHEFEENPKKFAEAIFEGIHKANRTGKQESMGFNGYCNYIAVEPSRHADDSTVFLHHGNTVSNLNAYNQDFRGLAERLPEVAKSDLEIAQRIITESKKFLKEQEKKK